VILIVIGILIGNFAYKKFNVYRFKKILEENDYTNYSLVETSNDTVTYVYVRNGVLLSTCDDTTTWVSVNENKRVIFNETYKTAIVDENDDELTVHSLNYTYINNYLEEASQKFKYLGKHDGYFVLQFTNKKTNVVTVLYLNAETHFIDTMIVDSSGYDFEANFEITVNKVTPEDVQMPNIDDYTYENSSSSNL
jgi:hypothetical protein